MPLRTLAFTLNPRDPRPARAPNFLLRGLLRLTLNGQRQNNSAAVEPGITLIEGLVAIIVVSLTVVLITPPIMLATATRIQTRRAEQARAIAQSEVDRVRIIVERGSGNINLLPKNYTGNGALGDPKNAPAATTIGSVYLSPATCGTGKRYPDIATTPIPAPVPIDTLIPVDIDGDCKYDFLMQVFRSEGFTPNGATSPYSFLMGVRVYANYNQASSGAPAEPLVIQQSSLGLSNGGQRDKIGGKQRPLAVLYTTIARNDSGRSLGEICQQAPQKTAIDCTKY